MSEGCKFKAQLRQNGHCNTHILVFSISPYFVSSYSKLPGPNHCCKTPLLFLSIYLFVWNSTLTSIICQSNFLFLIPVSLYPDIVDNKLQHVNSVCACVFLPLLFPGMQPIDAMMGQAVLMNDLFIDHIKFMLCLNVRPNPQTTNHLPSQRQSASAVTRWEFSLKVST